MSLRRKPGNLSRHRREALRAAKSVTVIRP
jgi:hypothetical protein